MIYIVMGPSGSGKTLVGEFMKEKGLRELVSHTTRPPRPGEVNGISYHFADLKTFQSIEKVEESLYAGSWYGVSKKEVEEKTKLGDVFAVTDVNGALAFKKMYKDNVRILYIASSPKNLRRRMKAREDSKENIRKRLDTFRKNSEAFQDRYAHMVINNDKSKRHLNRMVTYYLAASKGRKRPKKKVPDHKGRRRVFVECL